MRDKLPGPQVVGPNDVPALRWGILGTGWIADRFVQALLDSTRQRIAAVGSRNHSRAAEFARVHGVKSAFGSYEELVHSDVDVIYVATGHLDHHAHAALALRADKPVLIEKPMTPTLSAAQSIARLARERDVFCMEAVWSLALPRYSVVRQVLESGLLGDITALSLDIGEHLVTHPRALDPAKAGGAMNDLGTYPFMFANEVLTGLRVVSAHGQRHPDGAIGQFHALLSDEQDRLVTITASMLGDTPSHAVVVGTQGTMILEGPFYQPGPVVVRFHDGRIAAWNEPKLAHTQLYWEALEVAQCIASGRTESTLRPLNRSVSTIRLMEAARHLMGDPLG